MAKYTEVVLPLAFSSSFIECLSAQFIDHGHNILISDISLEIFLVRSVWRNLNDHM